MAQKSIKNNCYLGPNPGRTRKNAALWRF